MSDIIAAPPTTPTRRCSVRCGGPMDGWWKCGAPSVDSSGRCAKHTLLPRRFTLNELAALRPGVGVHVENNGYVMMNYSLLSVDFDAMTAVVTRRSGHGKGGARRAKMGLPAKSASTKMVVEVGRLIKPRSFVERSHPAEKTLRAIFDNAKTSSEEERAANRF